MAESKFKIKICLVGDGGVGKTSLIKKYVLDIFDDKYISTIGTKVSKKTQTIEQEGRTAEMDMMIWDIMGQSSFRVLLQDAYFYGAHGIIAVCDVTRPETLDGIHDWIDSTREIIGDAPIIFLANKCDLGDQMKVDKAKMDTQLVRYEMPIMMSSAKNGENVEKAFELLGEMILDKISEE
ncbi:MAG: GTP-binding protein [Thermoplasmata archaeon]|nr:GTP-binding protein [Thermoplasmata archaeon]